MSIGIIGRKYITHLDGISRFRTYLSEELVKLDIYQ